MADKFAKKHQSYVTAANATSSKHAKKVIMLNAAQIYGKIKEF